MILLQKETSKGSTQLKQEKNWKNEFYNNYIPEDIPDNLFWYKRDRLMTYIDKFKYGNVIKDTDGIFEKTCIINYDIFHK